MTRSRRTTGVRRRGRLLAYLAVAVLPLGAGGLAAQALVTAPAAQRSEERRVGKECVP